MPNSFPMKLSCKSQSKDFITNSIKEEAWNSNDKRGFQLGNSCLDDSAAFVKRRRKVQTKTNQNFCKISSVEKFSDCFIVRKTRFGWESVKILTLVIVSSEAPKC